MKTLLIASLLTFSAVTNADTLTIDELTDGSISSTFVDNGQTHVDTTTNLEWLNFSNLTQSDNSLMTMGSSIDGALSTYSQFGFRVATETEVTNLFDLFYPSFNGGTNGIMTINGEDPSSADILARNSWLTSFGTDANAADAGTTITGENGSTTLSITSGSLSSRGMYLDDLGNVQYAGVLLNTDTVSTKIYGPEFATGLNLTTASAYDNFGVFMVRDYSVVPVPAAAWLMLSGLLGLVAVARRK